MSEFAGKKASSWLAQDSDSEPEDEVEEQTPEDDGWTLVVEKKKSKARTPRYKTAFESRGIGKLIEESKEAKEKFKKGKGMKTRKSWNKEKGGKWEKKKHEKTSEESNGKEANEGEKVKDEADDAENDQNPVEAEPQADEDASKSESPVEEEQDQEEEEDEEEEEDSSSEEESSSDEDDAVPFVLEQSKPTESKISNKASLSKVEMKLQKQKELDEFDSLLAEFEGAEVNSEPASEPVEQKSGDANNEERDSSKKKKKKKATKKTTKPVIEVSEGASLVDPLEAIRARAAKSGKGKGKGLTAAQKVAAAEAAAKKAEKKDKKDALKNQLHPDYY